MANFDVKKPNPVLSREICNGRVMLLILGVLLSLTPLSQDLLCCIQGGFLLDETESDVFVKLLSVLWAVENGDRDCC